MESGPGAMAASRKKYGRFKYLGIAIISQMMILGLASQPFASCSARMGHPPIKRTSPGSHLLELSPGCCPTDTVLHLAISHSLLTSVKGEAGFGKNRKFSPNPTGIGTSSGLLTSRDEAGVPVGALPGPRYQGGHGDHWPPRPHHRRPDVRPTPAA